MPTLPMPVRGQTYHLVYDHTRPADALRTLGRWASNRLIDFDWHDAKRAEERITKTVKELTGAEMERPGEGQPG